MSDAVVVNRVDLEALFAAFDCGIWMRSSLFHGGAAEVVARASIDNLYRALHGDRVDQGVIHEVATPESTREGTRCECYACAPASSPSDRPRCSSLSALPRSISP